MQLRHKARDMVCNEGGCYSCKDKTTMKADQHEEGAKQDASVGMKAATAATKTDKQ